MDAICKKCGDEYEKFSYLLMSNQTLHLVGFCKTDGMSFLKYQPGLGFDIIKSKKLKKIETNSEASDTELKLPF